MPVRIIIFIITIFTLLFALILISNGQDGPDVVLYTLDNCVNQFDSTKIVKTKVGYQYWFVDEKFLDGRTLKMSVVAPHSATHDPHQHAEDEFFFVVEGTAEFYLNGKTIKAEPYASFYCPPNSVHGIRNVGETELKYLVIKKYNLE